jgi:hypothetical protein
MIDVIVINMKRSVERRARISARLNALNIPFRIFEAIDGYSLSPAERDQIAPPKKWQRSMSRRNATPGEVGCTLSHLGVIRDNAHLDFFCVLEDDAVLSPDFPQFLNEDTLRSLPKFDALKFHSSPPLQNWKYPAWQLAMVGGHSICTAVVFGGSCSGPVYSRGGAAKINRNIKAINSIIDELLYMAPEIPGFRILDVRPSVVDGYGENESTKPTPPPVVPPTRIGRASELISKIPRRVRIIRRFISTWALTGEIFSYPLWHNSQDNNGA